MNLEEYRSDRERFLNDLNDIENLIKIGEVRNFLGIDDDILKNFTYKDLKKFVLDKINNLSDLEKRELLELKKIAMDKYLRSFVREDDIQRQGPFTGYISLDKQFLKYYKEDMLDKMTPHMNIYDYMIKDNKDSDDMAIYYFKNRISYKKLDKLIRKCASSLINMGVVEGDKVVLCLANTPEALILFYALSLIGAVPVFVHPLSSEIEIRNSINEVESKFIFVIDSSYDKVLNIVSDTSLSKIITVSPGDSMPSIMRGLFKFTKDYINLKNDKRQILFNDFMKFGNGEIYDGESKYSLDRLAVILYTGGTTGPSKGVKLTDDNFNSMVSQFLTSIDKFQRGDHLLAIMPCFHGFGLCSSMHLPLSKGVSINMIPKLQKNKIVSYFKSNKVSCVIGVPTLFEAIISTVSNELSSSDIKKYFSSVKMFVVGGDVNSVRDKINDFCNRYGLDIEICDGYGLTEAVAGVTFSSNGYSKEGTVGIPMLKTNIKIVDPKSRDELPIGEVGEMAFSGPSIMRGYYNNFRDTSHSLDNGWLYTGDMGRIDEDYLTKFEQRKNDMIITSGYNVFPSKVSSVIMEHPLVRDCVVIGGYHPYKKEVPIAYVIFNYNISDEMMECAKAEIMSLCKKKLSGWEIPYDIFRVEYYPTTKMGKVDKGALQKEYFDSLSEVKSKTRKKGRY